MSRGRLECHADFSTANRICASGSLTTSPSAVTPTCPATNTNGPLRTAGEYPSFSNLARLDSVAEKNTGSNDLCIVDFLDDPEWGERARG